MPTHCELIEQQNIYFINEDKFVIDSEFEVNAPYGDYFRSYVRWVVEGKENVTVQATYGIVFSKSTIFQAKIIKEGTKETILTLNEV
jgi:hypothetical protein